MLFGDEPEWRARAERLAGKSHELVSFLTDVLGVTAVLTGLLLATYVSREPAGGEPGGEGSSSKGRFGAAGAIVSFFAVGCPVCNKLVLLALGTSGAMQYFEPIQPLLAALSVALLLWAFVRRATSEDRCPVPRGQAESAADSQKQVAP
jgi:Na+/H+ antiporter NhaD/arsenite permease-like protein